MALNTYRRTALIGGASGALDEIDGATLNNDDIAIVFTTTGYSYLYYLDSTSAAADDGLYVIAPDSNPDNKRWILTEVFNAKLVATTGIKFPATQIASSDANTLDDYEETNDIVVTLTCGTSGTVTLNSTNNKIRTTKIGRIVFATGYIIVDSVSSPVGTLTLGGLPYTVANSVQAVGSFGIRCHPTTAISGVTGYEIHPTVNNTTALIQGITTTGVTDAAPAMKANTAIHISMMFLV